MDFFFEIHKDLPREGPGDSESTRRAFRKLSALPEETVILDVGCGPGAQTLDLADLSDAVIYAVDTHQPFLDRLQEKVTELGLDKRIHVLNQSMKGLQFPPASFDLIWSEGAIYIMGFEAGLRNWKPLLKPGGYIAVTELTWLNSDSPPPDEVREFWKNGYPSMKSLDENLDIVHACEYYLIDYFVLPNSSWTDEYYLPMLARINILREQYQSDPDRLQQLDFEQEEIDIFNKYNQWYGYVFYIMQTK
ncbi:MAG: SAM-dependent methyltransferase [Chloroflexi bacterium HGW-Chloroflexi-3]|nr:MAG: SAM-dependent methyltransferase [Chloroflexi bacterium HGW-Chloroflexi-3]